MSPKASEKAGANKRDREVGPALAMLDLATVPAGLKTLDALVKEAEVTVVSAGTVQAGRYLILFGGDVESVEFAMARAEQAAGRALLDRVLLPYAEERILPAVRDGKRRKADGGDTLAVLQTSTTPTLLAAVDAALKGALVELIELRVAEGLGGQAIASLWGEVYDVEAAVELAEEAIARGRSDGSSSEIIRNAAPEVAESLATTTRFFQEWRG